MSSSGLERLNVWVQAKEIAIFVYKQIVPMLPDDEKWGLANQIKRSAASIPANIAEGYGRYYYQENIRFCYNARGSLEETISHIILASELGWIPLSLKNDFIVRSDILGKQLNAYVAYLRNSKHGINESGNQYNPIKSDTEVINWMVEENDNL